MALLDDCKYGHSCAGNVMGLTLLRSPKHPDPEADMGVHEFTYSLMPHGGDWREAGVDREAERLNNPLIARTLPAQQQGQWQGSFAPFSIETPGSAGLEVAAVKPAEDGEGLIVRLVETHGGRGEVQLRWNLPASDVKAANLLEQRTHVPSLQHDAKERLTRFYIKPFEIVTLALAFA